MLSDAATGLSVSFGLYVLVGLLMGFFTLIAMAARRSLEPYNFPDMIDVLVMFTIAWPLMLKLFHDDNGPWRG